MTESASSVTIPAVGTYQVDPASSAITFKTRHMFGLGPVVGRFDLRSGSVVVAVPVSASLVVAAVEAGSFVTGNPTRDEKVRSADFLDAQKHPEIVFTSTAISETDQGWVLRGEITARGVVAPVELNVLEVGVDGDVVTMRASGTVDRYAHGMTKLKGMAGRYLNLSISARAVRSS
jgi:polyisoprenoid-binding protein YceI